MTLWNLTTLFSREPSAGPRAYDPSRTGDPLGPSPTAPAIGVGETYADGASVTAPRRHPIGFAPPQETDVQRRYRTEISFKRHHELPRASAVADGEHEGTLPAWQTPPAADAYDTGVADVEVEASEVHANEVRATEVVSESVQAEVVEAEAVEETSVPFYKREITFRRKKDAPPAADDQGAVDELTPEELTAGAVVADAATESELDEAPVEETAAADEHVPFYRREIGFRRRKDAEAVAHDEPEVTASAEDVSDEDASRPDESVDELVSDATSDEAVAAEPEATDERVPFYEREISFRPASATAAAPDAVAADPVEEEQAETAEHVAEGDVEPVAAAEPAPDPDLHADATDDEATIDVTDIEEPVAVSPDAPEAVASEPVADVAAAAAKKRRRFGGRERNDKEPRRNAHRGHGHHKGGKVVGLKIGASQIAAAVVSEGADGNELHALASRPLEAGIVVDGEVRDQAALTSALKAFFEAEDLPRTNVRIGLSSNRIGVRAIDIPAIDDPVNFDNAVRFKAHEVLPVALSESMLDYRVLGERTTAEGEVLRRVLLVVAPRDQVEPYQRVAEAAGIRLAGADLEALALLRAFVEPGSGTILPGGSDTATVVVAVGHESSTLLVAGGGTCEFTRVFDWGGSALIDAIATTLNVRPVEAASILRHLSLTGPGRQYENLDETGRLRATDAVRQRLTPFARELVNSLQFYQTQEESLGIGRILITGGTSHLEGIDAALSQMIGVEVAVGDPFARVTIVGDLDPAVEKRSGSLAVPIGLAVTDDATRGVDLLPRQAVKSRRDTKSTAVAVAGPVAVALPLAAMAILYMGAHGKAADQQSELDALQTQIEALPQPKGPVIDSGVVGDEAARATAVASLLGGRVEWDGVLRDFTRVLPANVWLTSLSFAQADPATPTAAAAPAASGGPATPSAVSIDGYTYTQRDVALLLARLATLPSLQRVTLTKSERATLVDKQVVHFTIVADLAQTGGAS